MAKRKSSTTKRAVRKRPALRRGRTGPKGPQGPEGQRGERGAQGEAGAPGANHTSDIVILKGQVEQLVKELQTQLTRIAQIQAQVDHVSTGQASEPRNRRRTDNTEH